MKLKTHIAILLLLFSVSCQNDTESFNDVTSPSVPQDLVSSNITTTGAELSWSASSDEVGVAGYKVYRDGAEVANVTGTSYTATGLSSSTTYSYQVSAYDAAGIESSLSGAINVTTESSETVTKVLVFTKTSGYDHNTRSEASSMTEQIGDELGFDVTVDDIGSEFDSLSNLMEYAIIFFTNTSGDMLNDAQRSNVEAYAAQGGNFISNHAASDAYGHSTASTVSGNGKGVWDWYSENVTGCSIRNNPNHTSSGLGATVTVLNQNEALTKNISFPWEDNEEWYYWEGGYLNSSFTELLRVSDTGPDTYDDPRMTAQYITRGDGGKSFYSSMGHSNGKYTDSEFFQLMANAFEFLLEP